MSAWVLSPGINIRFVERDGKRILQQVWVKGYWLSGVFTSGSEYEWRDVPLVEENAPEDIQMWSEQGFS